MTEAAPCLSILFSNGYGKFPLAAAAGTMHRRGHAVRLVTGAYPKGILGAVTKVRRDSRALSRLAARREDLPDENVYAVLRGEVLNQVGVRLSQTSDFRWAGRSFESAAANLAASQARKVITNTPINVYHVRSGYGGLSLTLARKGGIRTFVDHSIVHPRVLPHLLENGGRLPDGGAEFSIPTDPVWRQVDQDLAGAEIVVVNSDFVADTFIRAGEDASRVRVVYQGVEDDVISVTDAHARRSESADLRVLYAGTVERRKGVVTLLDTLRHPDWDPQWRLDIIGPWDLDAQQYRAQFTEHPSVRVRDAVGRVELARAMLDYDVFLFPSWAEGSARVVGMAMAAGCCSVVTPNSGSFLRNGEHGFVVPPGDHCAVLDVLHALSADRATAFNLGQRAATLVRAKYRYVNYGHRLSVIYGAEAQKPDQ